MKNTNKEKSNPIIWHFLKHFIMFYLYYISLYLWSTFQLFLIKLNIMS